MRLHRMIPDPDEDIIEGGATDLPGHSPDVNVEQQTPAGGRLPDGGTGLDGTDQLRP